MQRHGVHTGTIEEPLDPGLWRAVQAGSGQSPRKARSPKRKDRADQHGTARLQVVRRLCPASRISAWHRRHLARG